MRSPDSSRDGAVGSGPARDVATDGGEPAPEATADPFWLSETALRLGALVVLLAVWEALTYVFADLEFVFPGVTDIAGAIGWLLARPEFYYHLAVTAQEVAISFALAASVGVVGGVALSRNRFVAEGVELAIYYTQSMPKILLYPIMLLALGVGLESKVLMGFFASVFPIIINTLVGALNVRPELVNVARANLASRRQLLVKVYLPSLSTHLINGFRIGIGVAIIGVTLAENYAAKAGLGLRLHYYYVNFEIPRMYAVLIILFVLALAINLGLLKLQDYLNAKGYGTGEQAGDEFTF